MNNLPFSPEEAEAELEAHYTLYPDDDELFINEDYDNHDEDDEDYDCGFIPGVGCQSVGSEDCDWECSYSQTILNHPKYPHLTWDEVHLAFLKQE